MNCFREGPHFLVIAPDECIDCSMCVPECPVGAIYNATDLPSHLAHFTQLNADLAASATWKPITRSQAALQDHESWRATRDKLTILKSSTE